MAKSFTRGGIRARDASPATVGGVKGVTRVVNVSSEVDFIISHNLADEGKLGDKAVLDINILEAVEVVLVSIIKHNNRVKEAKRVLGIMLGLLGIEGGGGLTG